ncbi:amino acid adenylation domain-containing protein, partial [Amycolatopsis minnesotensis]|uniref:amino acid adenylation domain-containing protein n=1 Tax=Amycolatopsis minnesotensis TaxID=337894 RepID=UPI0031E37DD4
DTTPFERIVDTATPHRDPSRNPLTEAMIVLDNVASPEFSLPGLEVEELTPPADVSTHDLQVEFAPQGGGLVARISYSTALFNRSTVERMADNLVVLLDSVAREPDRELRTLPNAIAGQRDLALGWSGTSSAVAPVRTLPELFADQVRRSPDAAAVVFEGRSVTYRELDERANRIANRLVAAGVRPDDLVGICLDRGIELVASMLAVLKSGGAYLPLDPTNPAERLAYLLDDADVVLVLTDERLRTRLPSRASQVLCVDAERIADEPSAAPAPRLAAANLAYVIYTSGSTGRPKGVPVTHGNVARLLASVEGDLGFGPGDVWTLFHSYAFDFSVLETWGALLSGGTLVVVPWETSRSPKDFLALLVAERVTVLNQTPSAFYPLVQADREDPELGAKLALRRVVLSGEALDFARLGDWYERHDGSAPVLVNMYGITETTVVTSQLALDETSGRADAGSLIGAPIDGMRLYVMDSALRLAPIGAPGELYVAGPGLARGYLGRPELTAHRFVANPFAEGGDRLYRSGDLARWRQDGTLEYLGRADDQVKIRGFRIELGEVSAVLAEQPDIGDAAAVVREDMPGDKRLVCYATAAAGAEPDVVALRARLGELLPSYAVPSAIVVLAELPLTANGKLDRRALPAPDGPIAGTPYEAPDGEAEAALAEVWASVLGVPRVGRWDNFFDLGGDSILSIQMVTQARRAGFLMSTKDLFLHPSVSRLAAVVETAAESEEDTAPVVGAVSLTPIQCEYFESDPVVPQHFNQSVLIELAEGADFGHLGKALDAVLAQHDMLRARYRREDGEWRQRIDPAEEADLLTRHDLSSVDDSELVATMDALAARADASFALAEGPLVRALLFDRGDRRAWLFVTVHHLVVDGVSWQILLDDLDRAYRQLAAGEPTALGPKTTSFQTWASRLARHVAEGGFAGEVAFWTEVADRATAPVDAPRLAGSVGELSVSLTEAETEALLRLAPSAFRTRVNDVLLTALSWALGRWADEDVLIDLEGHGREALFDEVDLSRTVGWFTAKYPVALEVPAAAEPDWQATVKSVRRQLRRVPGNGIGYGALRFLAGALPAHPRPRVLFNYNGQLDNTMSAGALYHAFHEPIGRAKDAAEPLSHPLEIVGSVRAGTMTFAWLYSAEVYDRQAVERAADEFRGALRAIARHLDPALEG